MSTPDTSYPEIMSSCVDSCQRCHQVCLDAAQRMLETPPSAGESNVFTALVTCIGLTRLTAEMALTDSGSHQSACELCAKACKACAELCAGNPALANCVKACLECAHCCLLAADQVGA